MQTHTVSHPTTPSQADRDLIAKAALVGVKISARQLKRWRAAGLLPSPARKGLGRGLGSRSLYPPGALDRAIALARLPRRARTPGAATLSLFALGAPVDEAGLRQAHSQWMAGMEARLLRGARSRDQFDLAEEAAKRMLGPFVRTRLGRQYLGRLRHRDAPSRVVLLSALTAITSLMVSGRPSSAAAFGEYLDATGTSQVLESAGVPREQALDEFLADEDAMAALGALSLRRLEAVFSGASLEELCRTRDDLNAAIGWLGGPGLGLLKESPMGPLVEGFDAEFMGILEHDLVGRAAIGVPMVLTVRRLLGSRLGDFLAWVSGRSVATAA